MERDRPLSRTPAEYQGASIMDFLLEDVRKVPLLTREEEVTLFKRIEAGRNAEMTVVRANGNLRPQKREGLLQLVEGGKGARDHVIRANLRLVVSIAKTYQGRGLHILDLFQGGAKGLIKATEKFDYKMGNRFSTYATYWIRQSVQREAADFGRTIRIPIHSQDKLNEIFKVSERLRQEFNREPSFGEVADAAQTKRKRVAQLISAGPRPISLETPTGEDGEAELIENIPSNGNGNPQQYTESLMLSFHTQELLSKLSAREERIVRMRYGLNGKGLTLQEVADKLGITRQRVQQIQENALSKMKRLAIHEGLSEFLN